LSSKISKKDKEDWENFISNDQRLTDKDEKLKKKLIKKVNTFDLHGYTLGDANKKIKDLIYESFNNGISKLIIVTGKGIHSNTDKDVYISKDLSKLKNSVPEYIKSDLDISKHIISISNADIADGGEGAIIIKLKKL